MYRLPSPPLDAPEPQVLDLDFWNEPNSYLESRAVKAADDAIVLALRKLARAWHRETQNKYPNDYHVIAHDLDLASRGKAEFIRVSGESKYLIGALVALANLEGLLFVETELFERSTADRPTMIAATRESAIRWIQSEGQIRHALNIAFAAGASRLDKLLLRRYEGVAPAEVMQGVYFRGIAQGDTLLYDSTQLTQDLYHAMFE